MTEHFNLLKTIHTLTWRNQDEQPKMIGEIALIALIDNDGKPFYMLIYFNGMVIIGVKNLILEIS